jgi:sialate O-acetylesterase
MLTTRNKMKLPFLPYLAALTVVISTAEAKLELPRVFGDDMVVQRDKPVQVWGWADKGAQVAVEFSGQSKKTTADDSGKWLLALDAMPANAKPQALTVKTGTDSLTLKNILIGDVWLCSGQSNMESDAGGIVNSDLDMPLSNIPAIRCLTMPLRSSSTPLDNFPIEERNSFYVELKGVWRVSTTENAKAFPAVGYHFAKIVNAITGVPIGLIDNSWGGSVVETWVSRASLEQIPEAVPLIKQFDTESTAYDPKAELARKMDGWKNQAAKAEVAGKEAPSKPEVPKSYTYRQSFPGGCFNGLIAPIQKFAIKGAIFYQGENNCVAGQARPNLYQKTYSALIPDWRKAFNDPELPFCIVQLCSFGEPDDENEPELSMLHRASGVREAQLKAHLQHKNTGIVPTFDLGHVQMHSPFKRPIGERAARWALATVYHVKDITYDIPLMESWKKDGQRILLTFTQGSHPSSPYGMRVQPKGFVIAGKDRHFYPAQVEAEQGDTFSVTSECVPDPVAVRYAWGVHPIGNFGNRAAPTPPFRTDDWPAWNDAPIEGKSGKETLDPEVPTIQTAAVQACIRKTAAAKKVLADLDTPQKDRKPTKN